jgi:hypothetical protein
MSNCIICLLFASAFNSKNSIGNQALKSVALERVGRPEEALAECMKLKKEEPTDEAVLSTMYLTWRALGRRKYSS